MKVSFEKSAKSMDPPTSLFQIHLDWHKLTSVLYTVDYMGKQFLLHRYYICVCTKMCVYYIYMCVYYVCIHLELYFFFHADINENFIKTKLNINYSEWKEKNYYVKNKQTNKCSCEGQCWKAWQRNRSYKIVFAIGRHVFSDIQLIFVFWSFSN